MGQPIYEIEEHVIRMLDEEINPALWKLECSAELESIQPHENNYLVALVFECDDEIPEEAHELMREMEWFLRDELAMPELIVEAQEV